MPSVLQAKQGIYTAGLSRRDFLRGGFAAAGAAALVGLPLPAAARSGPNASDLWNSIAVPASMNQPGMLAPVELVMLNDCSGSITDNEYILQNQITAAALRSRDVQQAIFGYGGPGSISVYAAGFGSYIAPYMNGWGIIHDENSLNDFASVFEIMAARPRPQGHAGTWMTQAIDYCVDNVFPANPYGTQSYSRIIDMISDGIENWRGDIQYRDLLELNLTFLSRSRDRAAANGIIINALAIENNDMPEIAAYYESALITREYRHVNGRDVLPGFVRTIAREQTNPDKPDEIAREDYFREAQRAIRRKLVIEIAMNQKGRVPLLDHSRIDLG